MSKVKIASFLTERKVKYKPTRANASSLKRIEKIDFDGNIFLTPINTNTDMILVQSGDLVISGINVEKGALAVYEGEDDVLASIHYSAYTFDESMIDISYLKLFLKSRIFRNKLKEKTGGGIKKEIKPKHLLSIEIDLPVLSLQHEIVNIIASVEDEIIELNDEMQKQTSWVNKLRESILHQAVSGKLSETYSDDEAAQSLLSRIASEKEKLPKGRIHIKQNSIADIPEESIPFAIPTNWNWCRLGSLLLDIKYGTSKPCSYTSTGVPVLRIPNVDSQNNCVSFHDMKFADLTREEISELRLENEDILLIRSNGSASLVGRIALVENIAGIMCYAGYLMRLRTIGVDNSYLKIVFNSKYLRNQIEIPIRSTSGVKNINSTEVMNLLIPLPPLEEQHRIVRKVEELLSLCDEMENEIRHTTLYASQLMGAILDQILSMVENKGVLQNVVSRSKDIKSDCEDFLVAARGNIRKETWEHLRQRALELANEEK